MPNGREKQIKCAYKTSILIFKYIKASHMQKNKTTKNDATYSIGRNNNNKTITIKNHLNIILPNCICLEKGNIGNKHLFINTNKS